MQSIEIEKNQEIKRDRRQCPKLTLSSVIIVIAERAFVPIFRRRASSDTSRS